MDIYISKSKSNPKFWIIAYTNENSQNVFFMVDNSVLPLINFDFACDNINIEAVIVDYYEYEKPQKIKVNNIDKNYMHIWKPGLQNNIAFQLGYNETAKSRAKRDLSILIQKLQEILLYVEPTNSGLQSFSHKTRELLILSCTELENSLKFYLNTSNITRSTMANYIDILNKVDLRKYQVKFNGYAQLCSYFPFGNWNKQQPTQSLSWYDAYNKTKHDKDKHFNLSTLENAMQAVAANMIMFCVRYSPYAIFAENDFYSNIIRNFLEIDMPNATINDLYIPHIVKCEK